MNWTQVLFNSIGGLGLFLMGIKIMSDGMQKAAGERLRKILSYLTSNKWMGITVGFLVTSLIQSSSATTVMVVGFVNATLMTLEQAIGVILGANIGTTVTGWLITLSIEEFSLPLIGLGVFIHFFSKSEKWKYIGEIIFGFGILFLGMLTMKNGFGPLRDSPLFLKLFTSVSGATYGSALLAFFFSLAATGIIQSSSAMTGIIIALASQGLLDFNGCVAMVLGQNIGTTVTAQLASIGANFHARRAAMAHTLFNTFGAICTLIIIYPYAYIIEAIVPGFSDFTVKTTQEAAKYSAAMGTKPYIATHIAMAHTMFNILYVLIFAWLIPFLAGLCKKLIPEPGKTQEIRAAGFSHVDHTLLKSPALGIAETERIIILMAQKVANSALIVQDIVSSEFSQKQMCDAVLKEEKVIDEYKQHLTEFLITLSSTSLSERDATHIGNYMALSHYLEKYADHLESITLTLDKIDRTHLNLSDEARASLIEIFKEDLNFFNISFGAMEEHVDAGTLMDESQVVNRRIRKLIQDAKLDHFTRFQNKICNNEAAVHFIDLLNYLDGMRSQAYNIAEITSGTKYRPI